MARTVKPPAGTAPRPGRPRSLASRAAILRAARALLAEGGPAAVTMEAVAARAGVGKPTVYRWWPDRHAVAMAALMEEEPAGAPDRAPRRSVRRPAAALAALRTQLHAIASRFATPTGRLAAGMIAAADTESEIAKAFRNHFVLARRAEGRALLRQAVTEGAVRGDCEPEVVLDLLYGPLFFRLLLGHAPLDLRFVDQLLDGVLRGLAPPRRAKRSGPDGAGARRR